VNGPERASDGTPTETAECVVLITSRYIATFCIEVSQTEVICPAK
jgi:hypothetical protein